MGESVIRKEAVDGLVNDDDILESCSKWNIIKDANDGHVRGLLDIEVSSNNNNEIAEQDNENNNPIKEP
ncbi:unnamed protein product [Candida verbasci]|uniref:Uncharacterized protein n=1 Tax=Candida verbasci TaxID=1227364 RepID=A0A9W4TYH4_9ASCO|nr:unnamed protein product [Candida verbasci]